MNVRREGELSFKKFKSFKPFKPFFGRACRTMIPL
jgi:hypothetical protein